MTVTEIEIQLSSLNRSEKAQIVQRLMPDIISVWPGVEKTLGVVGGDACIVRTRIPVWMLENYRRIGWTEAQILDNFPSLRAADLVNAWSYFDAHRAEIDDAIEAQEAVL